MGAILRLFAAGGVPASIVANVLALAHLTQSIAPTAIAWRGIFAAGLGLYDNVFLKAYAPLQKLVENHSGITLSAWMLDLLVLYAATAAAFSVGGPALTGKASAAQRGVSALSGLGWPISVLTFAFNAVRKRTLSSFAARHSWMFGLYIIGVAAVFAGAIYLNRAL